MNPRRGRKAVKCFKKKHLHFSDRCITMSSAWLVGQAVKTPPSHGGNSGSIPLRAARELPRTHSLREFLLFHCFFLCQADPQRLITLCGSAQSCNYSMQKSEVVVDIILNLIFPIVFCHKKINCFCNEVLF